MLKVLMEKEDNLYHQMLNFNRDGNYKSQMEMLEVKNMIIEMKNSLDKLISKRDMAA